MNSSVVAASHYGVVRFGDLECEAVVLNSGERGYARRQLAKLLGFHETHKGGRFARSLADFSPNRLLKYLAVGSASWRRCGTVSPSTRT